MRQLARLAPTHSQWGLSRGLGIANPPLIAHRLSDADADGDEGPVATPQPEGGGCSWALSVLTILGFPWNLRPEGTCQRHRGRYSSTQVLVTSG